MLSRCTLPLLIVLTSASVMAFHPHLSVRAVTPECASKCNATYTKWQHYKSGVCDLTCICTPTTINDASTCYTCLTAAGIDPSPLSATEIQKVVRDCAAAGYPVAGASSATGGSGSPNPLGGTAALPPISSILAPSSAPSITAVKNSGAAVDSGTLTTLLAVATTCLVGLVL